MLKVGLRPEVGMGWCRLAMNTDRGDRVGVMGRVRVMPRIWSEGEVQACESRMGRAMEQTCELSHI